MEPRILEGFTLPCNKPPDFNQFHDNSKENVVIVRVSAGQGYAAEEEEKIPKEEAFCKFCFHQLGEDSEVFKTICQCKFGLIHQACAGRWARNKGDNNCDACGDHIRHLHVTLSSGFIPPRVPAKRGGCSIL